MLRVWFRCALALLLAPLAAAQAQAQAPMPYVAFTAIVEHPALDDVRKGALEELAALGYKDKQTLRTSFDSAQGQPANAAQIAAKLVGQRPSVIVAISTPSAQSVLAATNEVPIVFSAVTDPVAAKLVADPARPGANVTGVTDMAPVAQQVELARQLVPSLKRLGVIYNPGETNSIALIAVLRRAVKDAGLELVESAANRSADLSAAAERLVGRVDALYLPTDNVVASGLEAVVAVARQNRMPTIGDAGYVPRGVLVGSGFNYVDLGRITGRLVADILKGRKPGDLPVASSTNLDVVLNAQEAQRIGLAVPPALAARAKPVAANK
ncbi:MAG: ABC transporter substrate-binding protein [Proteobacteria bacterium]|nr:ABC transporter substrate-binding protein [Pseudomonadota bacterium]